MASVFFNVRHLRSFIFYFPVLTPVGQMVLINLGFAYITVVFIFVRVNWKRWCFWCWCIPCSNSISFLVAFVWYFPQFLVPSCPDLLNLTYVFISLVLSCTVYFTPIPISVQMSLERNGAVLIKRLVGTKAKSPDNTMFSLCLKWMLLSVIAQLRVKLNNERHKP